MHVFQLLLSGLVLLQPAPVPSDTGPTGTGPSEQVRRMLTRLDRANRIVLGDDEVAVERAKAILRHRQIAQGKRPSQAELERLRQTTADRERAAVERLARQFRIEVYRTFRQRRNTVAGRRAALARVLAAWESAGRQFDEQEWLIDWLEAAIHNSTSGSVGPMPKAPVFTLPEFESPSFEPLVAGAPPARIAQPVSARPALSSATPPRPRVTFPARLAQRDASVIAELATIEQPPATALLPDRPAATATAAVAALRRPAHAEPAIVAHRPVRPPARRLDTDVLPSTAPGDSADAPVPSVASRRSNVPLPSESVGRGPTGTLAPRSNRAMAIPEPPAVPADPLATMTPRRAGSDRPSDSGAQTPPLPSRTAESAPRLLPVMEDPFAGPAAPRSTATLPLPDSLAMIEQRDGPAMRWPVQPPLTAPSAGPPVPSSLPPTPPRHPRASTGSPDSPPPTPADLPERIASLPSAAAALPEVRPPPPRTSASAVRVNIDELKIRIAGTNLALRAVEDDVDEDLRWTAARLEPLVDRLGGVIERRSDLSLFVDLLGPRDRSRVGRLDSTRLAVSQLAARIVDTRAMVTVELFGGSDADRRRELARLDRLSRTLAEMVVQR